MTDGAGFGSPLNLLREKSHDQEQFLHGPGDALG